MLVPYNYSGGLTHINEVALRRAGLVLGWVRRYTVLVFNQPPGLLSLAIPPWVDAISTGDGLMQWPPYSLMVPNYEGLDMLLDV